MVIKTWLIGLALIINLVRAVNEGATLHTIQDRQWTHGSDNDWDGAKMAPELGSGAIKQSYACGLKLMHDQADYSQMLETGLGQLKVVWCSWQDWSVQQEQQLNFNNEFGAGSNRYQLENQPSVMCENGHYIAAYKVKNKQSSGWVPQTILGSPVWDPTLFIQQDFVQKQACRCSSQDETKGLSICMTGNCDPNQVCKTGDGCSTNSCNTSPPCTCQPSGSITENFMTYFDCQTQCKNIGMKIPDSAAAFQACLSTGCGHNGNQIWVNHNNQPETAMHAISIKCFNPLTNSFGNWKETYEPNTLASQEVWSEEYYLDGLTCGIEVADGLVSLDNWVGIQALRVYACKYCHLNPMGQVQTPIQQTFYVNRATSQVETSTNIGSFHQTSSQSTQVISDIIQTYNQTMCPISCDLQQNCDSSQVVPTSNSGNLQVWSTSSYSDPIKLSDPIFYVDTDPRAVFKNTYCISCLFSYSSSLGLSAIKSGNFDIEVKCPSTGIVVEPPSSLLTTQISLVTKSPDTSLWPRFYFDSFHTNSLACQVQKYEISSNRTLLYSHVAIFSSNLFEFQQGLTNPATLNQNQFIIQIVDADSNQVIPFFLFVTLYGGQVFIYEQELKLIAACPTTITFTPTFVDYFDSNRLNILTPAMGTQSEYEWQAFQPDFPSCHSITSYSLIDVTSTGVANPFQYWSPSCCCGLQICTKMKFDISQDQVFTFKLRVHTENATQFFDSPTITITVTSDPIVYTFSWVSLVETLQVLIQSSDIYTFQPPSCDGLYNIKFIFSSNIFSSSDPSKSISDAIPIVPAISNLENGSGNQELTFDTSTLRVFNFYILAYLDGLETSFSFYPNQISVSVVCGSETISLNQPQALSFGPYERNSVDHSIILTNTIFSTDISECDVTKYALFQSASNSLPWLNSQIQLINPSDTSTASLLIQTSNPFKGSVYLQGLSSAGKENFKQIDILVCGNEVVSSSFDSFQRHAFIGDPTISIPHGQYSLFFVVTNSDHSTCSDLQYTLYDHTCNNPQSQPLISLSSGELKVETTSAFLDTTVCLKAKSFGHKEATYLMTFTICGMETISLKNSNSNPQYRILTSPSEGDKTINIFQEFGAYFESDSSICLPEIFQLLEEKDGKQISLEGGEVTLSGSNLSDLTLTVLSSNPFDGQVVIRGNSLKGLKPAYLHIDLKICGFEKVDLKSEFVNIETQVFTVDSGIKTVYTDNEYMQWFEFNDTDCPIAQYSLVKDENASPLNEVEKSIIFMENHSDGSLPNQDEIRVNTDNVVIKDTAYFKKLRFYLEAASTGNKKAYKKFIVQIKKEAEYDTGKINFPPYFSEPLVPLSLFVNEWSQEYYGKMNDNNYTEKWYTSWIYDREESYKKINIEIENEEQEASWIKFNREYDQKQRAVRLYIEIFQLALDETKGGTHIFNIILTDGSSISYPAVYPQIVTIHFEQKVASFELVKDIIIDHPNLVTQCQPIIEIQQEEFSCEITNKCNEICSKICRDFFVGQIYVETRDLQTVAQYYQKQNLWGDPDNDLFKHEIANKIVFVIKAGSLKESAQKVNYAVSNQDIIDTVYTLDINTTAKTFYREDGQRATNLNGKSSKRPAYIDNCVFNSKLGTYMEQSQTHAHIDTFNAILNANLAYFRNDYEVSEEILKAMDIYIEYQPVQKRILLDDKSKITIEFNETLIQPTEFIMQSFNETTFDIWIQSAVDGSKYQGLRQGYQEGQPLHDSNIAGEELRFTWDLIQTVGKTIQIQITFEFPGKISSTSYGKDLLFVKLNPSIYFRSTNSFQNLNEESLKMKVFELKPLPPSDDIVEQIRNTVDVSGNIQLIISVGAFLINIALSKTLQDLWGMLNSQQLIIHLAMMDVPIPGNAMKLVFFLSFLTQKDMYPTDEIYPLLFDFSETESLHQKFENLGYEGTNFVELQGSGMINIFVCILNSLAVISLIKVFVRLFKYALVRRIAIKIPSYNPFVMVVRVFIETYLEFMFSAVICVAAMRLKEDFGDNNDDYDDQERRQLEPMSNKSSDDFSNALSIIVMVILIVLPLAMMKIISHYFDHLQEKEYQERIGLFYNDLNTKSVYQTIYHAEFLIRRAIYVITVVLYTSQPILQLIIHIITTILHISFIIYNKPFIEKYSNHQEIFNECAILVASYQFFLFLNVSLESDTRNLIGWTFCGIVYGVIAINCIKISYVVLFESVPRIYFKFVPPEKVRDYESWKEIQLERFQNLAERFPKDKIHQVNYQNFKKSVEHHKKVIKTRQRRKNLNNQILWYHEKGIDDQETLKKLIEERDGLVEKLKLQDAIQIIKNERRKILKKHGPLKNKKGEKEQKTQLKLLKNSKSNFNQKDSKLLNDKKVEEKPDQKQFILVEDQFQADSSLQGPKKGASQIDKFMLKNRATINLKSEEAEHKIIDQQQIQIEEPMDKETVNEEDNWEIEREQQNEFIRKQKEGDQEIDFDIERLILYADKLESKTRLTSNQWQDQES